MLLTITYNANPSTGENALDLGFLLFKNPNRPQVFEMNYGKAYVFYPQADVEVCTAALLLDIDPLDLARGKVGSKDGGLFDYVNDRPYVSSSFMSSTIAKVFGTALSGRCDQRPGLAEQPLALTAVITTLPCKGDPELPSRIFEPLGYSVSTTSQVLDETYPEWGEGKYIDLVIKGRIRLQDLLHHLYVLIPVFDRQKHYWVGHDEVNKLLRHGKNWLDDHPEKEMITNRYMGGRRSLARQVLKELQLDCIDDGQSGATGQENDEEEPAVVKPPSLNTQRLEAVLQALKETNAVSIIDLGCGEGNLLSLLLKDRRFTRIAGTDVSWSILERANQKLKLDRLAETQRKRISLFQGSLTYKDERFQGYDAACIIEVIEHLDQSRLMAFSQVIFGETRPQTVILTTPNVEYNKNYPGLAEGNLRHGDHRFEWTRQEFSRWAKEICRNYGYTVVIQQIGDKDEVYGTPTQMGVFTLCK